MYHDAARRSRRSRANGANEPTLATTHLQPAQLTTVGQARDVWMQDLVLEHGLDYRPRHPAFPGVVKGTDWYAQASFLNWFDGDHERFASSIVA